MFSDIFRIANIRFGTKIDFVPRFSCFQFRQIFPTRNVVSLKVDGLRFIKGSL